MVRQSNQEACSRLSLCCRPRLVGCAVTVITVWAHVIVGRIGEFLHNPVQLLLRSEFIQVGAFVLQGVEVPLHWRIVIGVSGFTHALDHMDGSAELGESLRRILASLVAVQDQPALCRALGIQCFRSVRTARPLVMCRSVMLATTLLS